MASFLKRIGLSKLMKQFRNALRVACGKKTKGHKKANRKLKEKKQKLNETQAALESSREHAERDPLTNLLNRRGLETRYEMMRAAVARENAFLPSDRMQCLALVHFDVDDFKRVNDTYGHGGGDKALRFIAEAIRETVRVSGSGNLECERRGAAAFPDAAARVVLEGEGARQGGDEFVVLLKCEATQVPSIVRRLKAAIDRSRDENLEKNAPVPVSCSFGVAWGVPDNTGKVTLDNLINAADRANYEAKESGKNRIYSAGDVSTGGKDFVFIPDEDESASARRSNVVAFKAPSQKPAP